MVDPGNLINQSKIVQYLYSTYAVMQNNCPYPLGESHVPVSQAATIIWNRLCAEQAKLRKMEMELYDKTK